MIVPFMSKYLLYSIPLIGLLLTTLFLISPQRADWFAREDFILEYTTAALAIAASVILFVLVVRFAKAKQWSQTLLAALLAIAFFVIGMEEISWMQRIIGLESPQYFIDNNWQAEINLHNLDTEIIMSIFHAAVFVLFVLVPFLNKNITTLLKRVKLSRLSIFIPARWLIIPAIIQLGYAAAISYEPYSILNLTINIGTILILIYYIVVLPKELSGMRLVLVVSFIVFVITYITTATLDFQAAEVRGWMGTEYRELFACLIFFLYALHIFKVSRLTAKTASR